VDLNVDDDDDDEDEEGACASPAPCPHRRSTRIAESEPPLVFYFLLSPPHPEIYILFSDRNV
jgi:hypothetical protein